MMKIAVPEISISIIPGTTESFTAGYDDEPRGTQGLYNGNREGRQLEDGNSYRRLLKWLAG